MAQLTKGFPTRSKNTGTNIRSERVTKNELHRAQKAFESTLRSSELRRYRTDVVAYLAKPRDEDDRFDLSIAQRWILQRVFDLGWTVEKFGAFDRDVNAYMWSRDAKKSERVGKKYQWIAYHEFLALVADNFEFGNALYSDAEKKYEGRWQMFGRDIDPSCTLREIPGGDKGEDVWWSRRALYSWELENQKRSWVSTTADLPSVEPLLQVSNPEDETDLCGWCLRVTLNGKSQFLPLKKISRSLGADKRSLRSRTTGSLESFVRKSSNRTQNDPPPGASLIYAMRPLCGKKDDGDGVRRNRLADARLITPTRNRRTPSCSTS